MYQNKLAPIEAYYASITRMSIIDKICTKRFGKDVAVILMEFHGTHTQYVYTPVHEMEPAKVLLLGAEGVGKTTILKQLRMLYGKQWCRPERLIYSARVHLQIIRDFRWALDSMANGNNDTDEKYDIGSDFESQEANDAAARALNMSDHDTV